MTKSADSCGFGLITEEILNGNLQLLCSTGLVTKLNRSALQVLEHHYITKRIGELLIGNSRFLIHNSLNQLPYHRDIKESCLFVAEIVEFLDLNN